MILTDSKVIIEYINEESSDGYPLLEYDALARAYMRLAMPITDNISTTFYHLMSNKCNLSKI